MRVCYFGTYRANYVRNRLMIDRLRSSGVEVIECQASLWTGLEDRQQVASGGWRDPRFWWRVFRTYARLTRKYLQVGHYDVMIVGYPGQPDIPLARLLSWLLGAPLVWDVLMSIYLIAQERGLERRSPVTLRLIRWLECLACRLPDRLIIDTQEYASWFMENYGVPDEKIRLLPLGADDRIFRPVPPLTKANERFLCLYYGTFVPSHGVATIIEAARLLADETDIQFELIGQGPERDRIYALAERYSLPNVRFTEWMPVETLVQRVALADVCLGTFGLTPQALMTFQNKIHEGLAIAKTVINGDSPAMRSTLEHGRQIYLCERENPQALADAILALRADPILCASLATEGYAYYQEHLTFEIITQKLVGYLDELAN